MLPLQSAARQSDTADRRSGAVGRSRIGRSAVRVVAVLALTALAACGDGKAQSAEGTETPPRPVAVAPAVLAPHADDIRGSGFVAYKRELAMSFKIGGVAKDFSVDVGDIVAADQSLAVLDTAEIDAQWREAVANVEKAQRDVARVAPLVENGYASKARLDDARTMLKLAIAGRDSVAFNRSLAEIRAPAAGVILSRMIEPGQIVPAGQPVLTLGDRDSGQVVKVGIADREVVKIALGDVAEVRLPGIETPAAARVSRIAPKGDMRTGAFMVELSLDDESLVVPSGLVAEVAIRPKAAGAARVVMIPASAILEGFGAEGSVYVVDPETSSVVRRRVLFGSLSGEDVIIRDGLAPGEQVVSAGAGYLRDGDPVTVTDQVALREGGAAAAR
ncbi:efflux RND transporter periplasmic adaptor subunit [Zavarzinia compransoris]|uniref:efflux RND transporter periplasmic adaptor subunit n=1 Tax=Zavarzinia marina TaxID=2911065 RepID=UPI001F2CF0EA|nr:efflux RND transporter periplasmic adaptor subunit [Zavarzinia marina]MCF4166064.1 efflux RND transporter periplasmic adaptor subunit [Zavarzinia marina]